MGSNFLLPPLYTWFFLFVEPLSALVGAYFAHFKQHDYLQMTHAASSPATVDFIPQSTSIVLSQLANLYLLFAINEAVSPFHASLDSIFPILWMAESGTIIKQAYLSSQTVRDAACLNYHLMEHLFRNLRVSVWSGLVIQIYAELPQVARHSRNSQRAVNTEYFAWIYLTVWSHGLGDLIRFREPAYA